MNRNNQREQRKRWNRHDQPNQRSRMGEIRAIHSSAAESNVELPPVTSKTPLVYSPSMWTNHDQNCYINAHLSSIGYCIDAKSHKEIAEYVSSTIDLDYSVLEALRRGDVPHLPRLLFPDLTKGSGEITDVPTSIITHKGAWHKHLLYPLGTHGIHFGLQIPMQVYNHSSVPTYWIHDASPLVVHPAGTMVPNRDASTLVASDIPIVVGMEVVHIAAFLEHLSRRGVFRCGDGRSDASLLDTNPYMHLSAIALMRPSHSVAWIVSSEHTWTIDCLRVSPHHGTIQDAIAESRHQQEKGALLSYAYFRVAC